MLQVSLVLVATLLWSPSVCAHITECPTMANGYPVLCPICSDRHITVRWNASKEAVSELLSLTYACADAKGNTVSWNTSCFEDGKLVNGLLLINLNEADEFVSLVYALDADFPPGVTCTFEGYYIIRQPRAFGQMSSASCMTKNITVCRQHPESCIIPASCVSQDGQCLCQCNEGFGGKDCTNSDECLQDMHNNCDVNADCIDTDGSFECTCKPGYEGDGVNCSNVNECANGSHNCHSEATCADTVGSYECACNSGYEGDGRNCTNINECERQYHNCDSNANCTDTDGSFMCICNPGYEINGTKCQLDNVDECTNGTDNSDMKEICTDTNGCDCKTGYDGNNKNCSRSALNTITASAGAVAVVLLTMLIIGTAMAVVHGTHLRTKKVSLDDQKYLLWRSFGFGLDDKVDPTFEPVNVSEGIRVSESLETIYQSLNTNTDGADSEIYE